MYVYCIVKIIILYIMPTRSLLLFNKAKGYAKHFFTHTQTERYTVTQVKAKGPASRTGGQSGKVWVKVPPRIATSI